MPMIFDRRGQHHAIFEGMLKHPHLATSGRARPADEKLARAALALQMKQPVDAEKLAESVLKADRSHVGAATLLGQALLMQNRAADAVVHMERAARRSHDPALLTLLAIALAAIDRVDDALAHLEKITRSRAPYPPAYREQIARLKALGRADEAKAIAEKGIALMPQAIELHLDLAALHLTNEDRSAAIEVLRAAREVVPRADVLSELARVLLLDGDYATALDTYRHALALQPDNAMLRSNLAACQLELGLRAEGEASLRACVNGRPQMVGRAIYALSASSHGRFFLKPSAAANFLRGEKGLTLTRDTDGDRDPVRA